MSLLNTLHAFTLTLPPIPTKEDWQKKIDKVLNEYYSLTINLPRKQKKKRRKELNNEYSFLKTMQNYSSSFNF